MLSSLNRTAPWQAKDDIPVAFENMASYVRMLTIFGNAQV